MDWWASLICCVMNQFHVVSGSTPQELIFIPIYIYKNYKSICRFFCYQGSNEFCIYNSVRDQTVGNYSISSVLTFKALYYAFLFYLIVDLYNDSFAILQKKFFYCFRIRLTDYLMICDIVRLFFCRFFCSTVWTWYAGLKMTHCQKDSLLGNSPECKW